MKIESPLVTVIVSHHLDENVPYLKLCLDALAKSEGVEYETIVISSAETCPDVPDGMTLVHNKALDTHAKKIDFGVAMSDKRSKYFLFLSDDVMVSKFMIAAMAAGIGDQRMAVIPMSNGDNGSQFATNLEVFNETQEGWALPVHLNHEDVKGWESAIANFPLRHPLLVVVKFICFFCPMIPRAVWEEVGVLNPLYDVRHNDEDWCYRAARKGVMCAIDFSTFALHFGSKTLNIVAPEAMRDECTRHFVKAMQAMRVTV